MFIADLETDLKALNQNRNASIAVAVGGIIFPLLGGFLAGQIVGMNQAHAIFLGLVLSATSVTISVQTLKELGQLKSRESTTILGAALVDDILVVMTLAVMMSFLTDEKVNLEIIIGEKILFFIMAILLGWKVVPWVMRKLALLRVSESIISTALIICFFFAYTAETLGVAGIIGTFIAGIAISQTKYKEEVEKKIEPIAYAIFVPVFFVSIGLSVSFNGMMSQLWMITGLTILAIATKLFGSGLGAKLTGFNNQSSFGIGAGMICRGEVSLILAAAGLKTQLLEQKYFTVLIIVVILTTLVTPPMLKKIFGNNNFC